MLIDNNFRVGFLIWGWFRLKFGDDFARFLGVVFCLGMVFSWGWFCLIFGDGFTLGMVSLEFWGWSKIWG